MNTRLLILPMVLALTMDAFGADVAAPNAPAARTISTVGVAEREFAPDRAHCFVRIKAVKATFAEARDIVNAATTRLRADLKRIGVGRNDVVVSARSLRKEFEWDGRKQVYKGQACEQSAEVIVRDLEDLEAVTEAIALIEDLEMTGVDFRSSKEGEAKRDAMLAAAQAAREKAEALAKAAGVRITGVLEIEEENSVDSAAYGNRAIVNNLRQLNDTAAEFFGIASERVRVQVRARYAIE